VTGAHGGGTLRTEYGVRWVRPDGQEHIAEFGHRIEDRRRAEYALAAHPELPKSELVRRTVRVSGWEPVPGELAGYEKQPRKRTRKH
jgi:hypothetical protein